MLMRVPVSTEHTLPLPPLHRHPPSLPNSLTVPLYLFKEKEAKNERANTICKRTLKDFGEPDQRDSLAAQNSLGVPAAATFLGSMHWHDCCGQTSATESVTSTVSVSFSFGCDSGVSDMSGPPASGPESWDPGMDPAYDQHPSFLTPDAAPHMSSSTTPSTSLSDRATGASIRQHAVGFLGYSSAVGSLPSHTAPHPSAARTSSVVMGAHQRGDYIYDIIMPLNAFENPVEDDPSVQGYEQTSLNRVIADQSETFAQLGIAETTCAQTGAAMAYHPKSIDTMQSQSCLMSPMLLPKYVPNADCDPLPFRIGSAVNSPVFSVAGPSRLGVTNSNAVVEPNSVSPRQAAQDGIETLANLSNAEKYLGDESGSPGASSAVQSRDPSTEPESRRGKNRVYNPCHVCGGLKHIRSNQCKWCNAPKGPLAKRRPRSKSSD
jgi:hypothetical protein